MPYLQQQIGDTVQVEVASGRSSVSFNRGGEREEAEAERMKLYRHTGKRNVPSVLPHEHVLRRGYSAAPAEREGQRER